MTTDAATATRNAQLAPGQKWRVAGATNPADACACQSTLLVLIKWPAFGPAGGACPRCSGQERHLSDGIDVGPDVREVVSRAERCSERGNWLAA
jgi:hypothetical protein